jgi:nucleotide-binding universal stress UspA family protein
MFTRIAVPLDGSALGAAALPYAVSLTRLGGGSLVLLHVHRPYMPGQSLEALPQYRFQSIVRFDDEQDREATRAEDEHFAGLAQRLSAEHGIEVTSCVLRGEVTDALATHTEAVGADLIVMSTHGYEGAWRSRMQSIADALVRRSRIPVLLLRPSPGAAPPEPRSIDFRRILVPVDGSPFSESILDPVTAFAGLVGARPTLITVLPSAAAAEPSQWLPATAERPWKQPDEYLDDLADRFPVNLPIPETRVIHGDDAAAAILEEARTGEFGLIAMATHGRGGVRHMLVGSVADQVIRGTSVPVLVRRPQAPVPGSTAEEAAVIAR